MKKTCSTCKNTKYHNEFALSKTSKDGLLNRCRECQAKRDIEYRERNKEKIRIRKKKWREKNKEAKKEYDSKWRRENKEKKARYQKIWKDRNKEHINKYNKKPLVRIAKSCRGRIASVLKRTNHCKAGSRTFEIIGCTQDDLILHIESKFTKGMTLDNHGEWHIDHIVPLSSAKTKDDIILLCHYTNLQPLWAIDNLKKGSKILPVE